MTMDFVVKEDQGMTKVSRWKSVLTATAGVALMTSGMAMHAQAAPVLSPATAAAAGAEPQAPTPHATAPVNPFPPVNLKNFTADSPSTEEVNGFLKAIWGYDENRIWSVAAILKTPAPGVSKVVVYVADKNQPGKVNTTTFFITPDGKHAIADQVIDFGAKPFAQGRALLQNGAMGAAKGAAGKDLMFVEFADLLQPRSKEAQDTMANLAKDFPEARIVFEELPVAGHPYSMRAAEDGYCVQKLKGDAAFFTYAQAMFDKQLGLTTANVDAAFTAAEMAAGADPKAVATCAVTQETKDAVKATVALASQLGVESTPILVVNGHPLPLGAISYDTLKRIIAYQAGQDGIVVHVQPTLSNLQ